MRPKLIHVGIWAAAAMLALLAVAEVATKVKQRCEVDSVPDEQKLARSLGIIRTSIPTDRKVLKVLFYGQSITKSGWDKEVIAHWREKYPNTVFVEQNRALGGFPSTDLERVTEQDISAFYPDLIIFHVYGDHHAYERIIRIFRSHTAADIIVQADHGEVLPDPPCVEGLHLSLRIQPGCVGYLWTHQRMWDDEMSYHKIPVLAKKYSLGLEPQRTWWRDYLLRTGTDPGSMLVDGLHPNEKGKELIATFFNEYFDNLVANWHGQTEDHVVSIAPSLFGGQGTVPFDGNRLELFTSKPLTALPVATIDGIAPKDIDGCYQVSRATTVQSVPDWPAVRKISLIHDHIPEGWIATLTNFSAGDKTFTFAIKGSVTGDDGTGISTQDFVSKSGLLRIAAQDWMPERAFNLAHVPLPSPFEVHWTVRNVCTGSPEAIDRGAGSMQYRYVLVTGNLNGLHKLAIQIPPADVASVTEFRAYKPSLHE